MKNESYVVIILQNACSTEEENKWYQIAKLINLMQGDKRHMHKVLQKQKENVIIYMKRNGELSHSQNGTWNTQKWFSVSHVICSCSLKERMNKEGTE